MLSLYLKQKENVLADPKEFSTQLIKSFDKFWDNEVAFMGVGGSIPANTFTEQFPNAEIVLVGAGDEEGNAHAPNESVTLTISKDLLIVLLTHFQIINRMLI